MHFHVSLWEGATCVDNDHFIAGVRHLWMDARHAVTKSFGKSSAIATLAISIGLTLVLGAKLFGVY